MRSMLRLGAHRGLSGRTRRQRVRAAVIAFIVALSAFTALGVPQAQADPLGWPPGVWPTCSAPSDEYCLESATVTPLGGVPTDAASLGLSTYLVTLPSGGGPSSVNWAINGWRGGGVSDDTRAGEASFVFRVGQFVPRYTMAIAQGVRVSRVTDGSGDTTVTITGRPVQMNWNVGSSFTTTCFQGTDCGDENSQADATLLAFSGNTQDLGGWDPADQSAMDGMYIATNAQARPTTILLGTYPDLYWYMGTLGNVHLTEDGTPARGSFNAWMPASFFTSAGTTPSAAAATGFDVTIGAASGPVGSGSSVPATVSEVDGGVGISVPDMPFSVHAVTVTNEPSSVAPGTTAPTVPRTVSLTPGSSAMTAAWTAPASNGGAAVSGYTARAFSASSGGTVEGSCTSFTTSCVITGLSTATTYYVAVTASNTMGEGASSARVAGAPADPPGAPQTVTVTPGTHQLGVAWAAPATDGGTPVTGYTATAYTASSAGSVAGTCSSASTSCPITALTPGTSYYVGVSATNAVGQGTSAARVPGIPTSTPSPGSPPPVVSVPSAPLAPSARPGVGQLSASWKVPATDGGSTITGYTARAHLLTSEGRVSGSCSTPSNNCLITGLNPGTRYVVDVTAANVAGSSPATTADPAATPDLPGAPGNLSALPQDGRLAVSWTPPATDGGDAITGYTIEAYTRTSGGEPVTSCSVPATVRACVLTGLSNAHHYYLSAVATNGVGTTTPPQVRLSASPAGAPGQPISITAHSTHSRINVTWQPPASDHGAPITGYTVRLYPTATALEPTHQYTLPANSRSLRTGKLTTGRIFWVDILTTNTIGQSQPSPRQRQVIRK